MDSLSSHFPAVLPAFNRGSSSSLSGRRQTLSCFRSLPLALAKEIGLAAFPMLPLEKKKSPLQPLRVSEVVIEPVVIEPAVFDLSKTAHVKFVLKRPCEYGERYLLAGDDPLFGSWDPASAIPLHWSNGHLWTAELDLPVGKVFQFKFILKNSVGKITWQPNHDRKLEVQKTENIIIFSDNWDDPQKLKISDEDLSVINPADEGISTEIKTDIALKKEDEEKEISAAAAESKEESHVFKKTEEEGISFEPKAEAADDLSQKSIPEEEAPVLVPGLAFSQLSGSEKGGI